jgi:hypothetical protein
MYLQLLRDMVNAETRHHSYKPVLWIRIRFGDADPDPGARKLNKFKK